MNPDPPSIQTKFEPVTRELINQLIAAVQHINQLTSAPVKEIGVQAEIESATTFLAEKMVKHSGEFIGAWLSVANEYEPLIALFAGLQQRAAYFVQQRAKAEAAAAANKSSIIIPSAADTAKII